MGKLIETAKEKLQAQGGRMTLPRQVILEALECLDCHPTAEEVHATVRQRNPSINLSTVYRTLRWLESEGLVSARHFEDARRQERFDPARPVEHFHFICRECKQVIEFDSALIQQAGQQFARAAGVRVETATAEFYGLCQICLSRQSHPENSRE